MSIDYEKEAWTQPKINEKENLENLNPTMRASVLASFGVSDQVFLLRHLQLGTQKNYSRYACRFRKISWNKVFAKNTAPTLHHFIYNSTKYYCIFVKLILLTNFLILFLTRVLTFTTKKNLYFLPILFWFFFKKYLQILLWKKNYKKLLPIFLQNILYKILFAINFVRNICKFYNFIKNDYPQKITCQLKLLKKWQKNSLLAIFFNKFTKNSHIILRISSNTSFLSNVYLVWIDE